MPPLLYKPALFDKFKIDKSVAKKYNLSEYFLKMLPKEVQYTKIDAMISSDCVSNLSIPKFFFVISCYNDYKYNNSIWSN